jgi:hypothetical protein
MTYGEVFMVDTILGLLLNRLTHKGLISVEIPRLVEDVVNIVKDGGNFTVNLVNNRLENLGWNRGLMDEATFDLIICLMENEEQIKVDRQTLH